MATTFKKVKHHLSKDPIMKKIIDPIGELEWDRSKDPFEDLVSSIVSQQLSGKAADTIYTRFKKLLGRKKLSPKNVLNLNVEEIRSSGISYSKATYLQNLANAIESKQVMITNYPKMDDKEIIDNLTQVKGIGKWTAEMFLMFTMEREDVFSIGDLGLRTAVSRHYAVERSDTDKIENISLRWRPYRTWASRYLWKSIEI